MTPARPPGTTLPLSLREAEVLEMVSLGLSNEQIGRRMGVTVHAVKFHLASVYRKLGVANRTQAAATFLRAAGAAGFEAGGRTG